MNRGCLTILGLGFISLFAFGVTLEAINDPQELSAIPFSPWDFVTYALVAVAIFSFVRLVRKRDSRKLLAGKWTSKLAHGGGCICTRLRLAPDGTAAIESDLIKGANSSNVDTQARWQLLDPVTLHLWGTQTITCRILKLNSWTMITANLAGAGCRSMDQAARNQHQTLVRDRRCRIASCPDRDLSTALPAVARDHGRSSIRALRHCAA